VTAINHATITTFTATGAGVYALDVAVSGSVIIDATSKIDLTAKGYLGRRTTGNAVTTGSGGSYGGFGGNSSGIRNEVYGDYAHPQDWGSGGQNLPGG